MKEVRQKSVYCLSPFMWNFMKCRLICSEQQQAGSWLPGIREGTERWWGRSKCDGSVRSWLWWCLHSIFKFQDLKFVQSIVYNLYLSKIGFKRRGKVSSHESSWRFTSLWWTPSGWLYVCSFQMTHSGLVTPIVLPAPFLLIPPCPAPPEGQVTQLIPRAVEVKIHNHERLPCK